MDYARFVALRRPVWEGFEAALAEARGRGRRLGHGELEELALGYRRILHDHALAAARFPGTSAARRLARLAVAGTHLLARPSRPRGGGLLRFLTRTFPRTFRRHMPTVGVAAALFAVTALLAFPLAALRPGAATAFLSPQQVEKLARGEMWTEALTTTVPPGASSSVIATNNLSVALSAWAGGALAGLGSLYILVLNGLMLGALLGVTLHYGMAPALLEFVAAHGPLEISLILFSAAAGLVLARGLVAAEDRPRAAVLREASRDSLVILAGCLPWLVLLALVEALISPSPEYAPATKAALGLSLLALFLTFALNPFAGRSGRG